MDNKIDIVLTWVDSNDLEWQKEKMKYSNVNSVNFDSRTIRYRDWENLKYIFRGIEKYASFINKVHFVTCGHVPDWLNIECPKLNIVSHKDFIPQEYLPTFNINPIETNFHRIKDLSEQFVYFNDDTFILRKLQPTDFFINGKPCDSAIENPIVPSGSELIDYILLNDMEILNNYFDKKEVIKKNFFKWYNLKYGLYLIKTISLIQWKKFTCLRYSHLPTSILKSTMKKVWDIENEKLSVMGKNRFRSKSDLNQYLFTYWQIMSGNFVPRSTRIGKFYLIGNDNKKIVDVIKKQKYKLICLNDSADIESYESVKKQINEAFEQIFPEKSSFEK